MLKSCLGLVGMVALPLVVEVLLGPRPCLALLWGALPLRRRCPPAHARLAAHSHPQTLLESVSRETDGLASEKRTGALFARRHDPDGSAVPGHPHAESLAHATEDVDEASLHGRSNARRSVLIPRRQPVKRH
jgi:hypothetical protein